jgi:di-N-acetylchitobiase
MDKLNSSVVRDEWIKNKTSEAIDNFADGINIDVEGPVPKDSKSVTLLSKLVKLTSESFHENIPGSQVGMKMNFFFKILFFPNWIK